MDQAEFDAVADRYEELLAEDLSASGESSEFFARYKVHDAAAEARARGVEASRILDFGSGIGSSLPHFETFFPRAVVTCADVSARSLAVSRERFPTATAQFAEIVGAELPFEAGRFDLAFAACVFHHIPPAEHLSWLAELRRVTRPGGLLVVFEHNPLNPLTLAAVRRCPFDANAVLIHGRTMRRRIEAAGWRRPRLEYRLFFPRALAFARPAERWLRRFPLGAQYLVVARHE